MQQKISTLNNEKVNNIVNTIFGRNMHSKRITSLANAAIRLLNLQLVTIVNYWYIMNCSILCMMLLVGKNKLNVVQELIN